MTVNHIKEKARALSGAGGQASVFDYDSYDWGCLRYLRYLLELWIFLNRLKKHKGVRGCWNLFNNTYLWLSENEELRKYDGQDYTAASPASVKIRNR